MSFCFGHGFCHASVVCEGLVRRGMEEPWAQSPTSTRRASQCGVLDAALSKGSLYGHIKGHRHAVAAPGSPCDVLRNRHLPQKSLKGAGGG